MYVNRVSVKAAFSLVLLLLLALSIPLITAQDEVDPAAEPAFITLNLDAGFVLDPFIVSVNGGGDIAAAEFSAECYGFISANPTVVVDWEGEANFLEAFFYSDHDPVLVILTPGGEILCNDDAGALILDPVIRMENPEKGRYAIWVGSYDAFQLIPGFLVFTANPANTIDTFDIGSLVQRPPLPAEEIEPNRAALETLLNVMSADAAPLAAGDADVELEVSTSGSLSLFGIDSNNPQCAGYISETPDYVFNWSGETDQLRIFFESDHDATLLVVGPGPQAFCSDDAGGAANLNPMVELSNPQAGTYLVFVGKFDPEYTLTGTLVITESAERQPAVLAAATVTPADESE